MVEVIYDGNLGNNLFQYCFGRILAERLGYRLSAEPIAGFPHTAEPVGGASYPDGEKRTLRGQKPDLSFLNHTDLRYHVLLTGYFQRYEYYAPHVQRIREWLAVADTVDFQPGPNDVLLGIRRGADYIPRHGLPISYYEAALASIEHDRVYICTNEPDDPFVRYFRNRHDAVVRAPGALDNLVFIRKFRKIVISNSTFLWWAAFLSDARQIVFPRPASGFWSTQDPISKNINLEIPEPRFQYLTCAPYRSEFLSEKLRVYSDATLRAVKRAVRKVIPAPAHAGTPPGGHRLDFSEPLDD